MIDLNGNGCGASEPFALRVLGDSMEPEFPDGSIVVVDPSGIVEDRRYVIAEHQGEWIFRQLRLVDDRCYLVAENSGYPQLELEDRQAVVGVVIQRAGIRRREHKHYIDL